MDSKDALCNFIKEENKDIELGLDEIYVEPTLKSIADNVNIIKHTMISSEKRVWWTNWKLNAVFLMASITCGLNVLFLLNSDDDII